MEGYIGEIRMFGGNFAPQGWAFCDGALLPIALNTPLFAILGTTYGGNGISTFALPKLTEKVSLHPGGPSNYILGHEGGDAANWLADVNMPPHTHPLSAKLKCATVLGTVLSPAGAYPANTKIGDGEYNNTHDGAYMAADAVSVTVEPINSSNIGFTNMQQFQVVNFIICKAGYFPARP